MANTGNLKPWPKGASGNPGGRPRRKLISDPLRDGLAACIERGDKTGAMVIADAILGKASKGDVAAAIFVRDTTEGKPVQGLRIEAGIDEATARRLVDLAEKLCLQDG